MQYKPYSLSVKAMIKDQEGRFLLLRRAAVSKSNFGKWEMPGGKVERGESFEEALRREVWEETGLEIVLEHVIGTAEWELPDKRIAYIILEGTLQSGSIILSEEHDAYIWVEHSRLPEMDLTPQFKQFINSYYRFQ